MKPWAVDGDAIRLAVRLTPRARRDEIAGVIGVGAGRLALAVRLAAPPVEGAANAALIALLARTLGLPRSAVAIVSGEKARLKIVRLQGASFEALERLVAA
jgi:uncharacterized protein (TIGR00251 family)